jgi:hypothetical protein
LSGPRVTSGDESMQDAATPDAFIVAVEKHFGPITFDLAAHRLNYKHPRYFAPTQVSVKYDVAKRPVSNEFLVTWLVSLGARRDEAEPAVEAALGRARKGEILCRNYDEKAVAFDSLKQDWAALSIADPYCGRGNNILYLNCEWADVTTWATKCAAEAAKGANVLLLTHVAIADWARDIIFGRADVHLLSGRLCFDGRNVLPKDCQLSHFWPGQTGRMEVWNWRTGETTTAWRLA